MGLVHALIISIIAWNVSNDAFIAIITGLLWFFFSASDDGFKLKKESEK